MEDFRIGDIVRIRGNKLHSELRPIDYRPLIFEITDIDGERVKLEYHSDFIPISDIEGVPVNGVDDADIYYSCTNNTASYVSGNSKPSVRRPDYTYFKKAFNDYPCNDINYAEMIAPYELNTVHEIQHFFIDKHINDAAKGLKVNHRLYGVHY